MSLPADWAPCRSQAIEAYRYLADQGVLQIIYRQGRMVYDFPCDEGMYRGFVSELRPAARQVLNSAWPRLAGWD